MKKADVMKPGSTYEVSLVRLTGRQIKDVLGYISTQYGGHTFKLTEIVFDDDTIVGVEGEHDFPYITTYRNRELSPESLNLDADALMALDTDEDEAAGRAAEGE